MVCLFAPTAALAADEPPKPIDIVKQAADDANVFSFDFAVPSSPALTLLGIDKDKVTQSNSLKPFAFSLPGLFDGKGDGQAVAVDFSLGYLIFLGGDRSYGDYIAKPERPFLFRTRTAAAFYEGVADADPAKQKSSRVSLGMSTSLLRTSDPLLASLPGGRGPAWRDCVGLAGSEISNAAGAPTPMGSEERATRDQMRRIEDRVRPLQRLANPTEQQRAAIAEGERQYAELDAQLEAIGAAEQKESQAAFAKTEASKMIPVCQKVADLAARLGPDLDFGAGAVWYGTPGKIAQLKDPSAVAWTSFRTAVNPPKPKNASTYEGLKAWQAEEVRQWFMVGVSGRFGSDEKVSTGDKTTPEIRADTYSIWGGLERYTQNSRLAFQLGREKTDPKHAADKAFKGSRTRYLASFDQRVRDGIWVSVSYGEASGTGSLKSDKMARVTLNFTEPDVRKIFGAP